LPWRAASARSWLTRACAASAWCAGVEPGLGDEVLRTQFNKPLQILLRQLRFGLGGGELGLDRPYRQRVILRIQRGNHLACLHRRADLDLSRVDTSCHAKGQRRLVTCPDFACVAGLAVARVAATCSARTGRISAGGGAARGTTGEQRKDDQ
jgi:hypothetical protein